MPFLKWILLHTKQCGVEKHSYVAYESANVFSTINACFSDYILFCVENSTPNDAEYSLKYVYDPSGELCEENSIPNDVEYSLKYVYDPSGELCEEKETDNLLTSWKMYEIETATTRFYWKIFQHSTCEIYGHLQHFKTSKELFSSVSDCITNFRENVTSDLFMPHLGWVIYIEAVDDC